MDTVEYEAAIQQRVRDYREEGFLHLTDEDAIRQLIYDVEYLMGVVSRLHDKQNPIEKALVTE